jgi:glycosyltransferase involved in cell wall biosynthesis
VIVDDCSTDNTVEIVRSHLDLKNFTNFKLTVLDENSGPGVARNTGWNNATSDLIALLDADDSWHPRKIEHQVRAMEKHPWAAFSGHPYIVSAAGFAQNAEIAVTSTSEVTLNQFLLRNRFSTPSVMARRSLTNRFSEDREIAEDYLLWLELLSEGHRALFIESALVCLHKPAYGESGLSGQLKRMERKDLRAFRLLRSSRKISAMQFIAASIFSYLKYLRRLMIVRIRQLLPSR